MLQALSDRDAGSEVIVVVDDAGWADVPSRQAMSFALRRLHADRVLVLLTCRSDLVAHLPAGVVSAVEADGQRIELTGLDRAAVADLVSALGLPELSSRTLRRLEEHTGGNPQYLRALLGELSPDALAGGDSTPLRAPRSYSDTVVDQLAALDDATSRLVVAAAVLGLHAPAPSSPVWPASTHRPPDRRGRRCGGAGDRTHTPAPGSALHPLAVACRGVPPDPAVDACCPPRPRRGAE